jgi:CDP-glucose 4,6-dehydratase
VQWIVDNLTKTWGEGTSWTLEGGDHPHEAHYLKLDCSKAKACLNWLPKWHLDEALDRIVNWQKQYQQGADMKAVTLEQIQHYALAMSGAERNG